MLQDQSRNRTPMPDAQQAADVALTEPGPARAEAGIARMLSEPSLPTPGSPEAMAAWRAACTEFDRRTHLGDAEFERLRIGTTHFLWTTDKVRSAIAGKFRGNSPAEEVAVAGTTRAELQELLIITLRRDLQFEEAFAASRVRECFAAAYPDASGEALNLQCGVPAHPSDDAAPAELSGRADPQLLAMVAELLEARRTLNDPSVPDGPEADAIGDRETAPSMAVCRFRARSIHDIAAKLPFLREESEDAGRAWDARRGEIFENSLPGAAWTGLLRDIAHLARVASPAQAQPDPILAAINASKSAHRVMDRWSRTTGGKPLTEEGFEDEARLNKAQCSAHDAVLTTVPTTAAGRLALLEYLRWQMGLYGMADGQPPEADSVFWPDAYKALKAALAFEGEGFGSALVNQPAVPSADLSKCSVPQLARLYEVFNARRQLAAVSTNAPFMWDGDNYNAAGDILEGEYERLTDMAADIAAEIERRQPQDEDERDERLSVLVRQSIEGSGCISDPALVAEIATAWKA